MPSIAEIVPGIDEKTPTRNGHQFTNQKTWIASERILQIAAAVKSASGLTEARFLEIGERLGSSVEILSSLTTLFSKLQLELDSSEMQAAIEGLARIAAQLPRLIGVQREERDALEQLGRLAAQLGHRIDEIQSEFRTIEVLTINARITASSIGSGGADFLTYIGEIGESLKLTETRLRHFRNDLMAVSAYLRAAGVSEIAFEARHAKTVAVIPEKLARSLELITSRRAAAVTAAGSVSTRSQQVSSGIARVITALQIGDATRQRMEHAQEAAELVARILASDKSDDVEAQWAALPDPQRQALAAAGCALQSAQLEDTADELRREISSVHSALAQLSANAREIVRLSTQTFGSTDHGGAFLKELEEDTHQAHSLFEGFRDARTSADKTMGAMLEIVTRLADHIGTVRNVEADIRMMGVNATLKSSRLGSAGAALSVVAAEITNSSARTAVDAKSATEEVQEMVVSARSLGAGQQSARIKDIETVTDLMERSTNQLRSVADGLAPAFDALARDGLVVVDLLNRTAASLAITDEIDASLRLAAANFDAIAASVPARALQHNDASNRMFELMATRYSMAREREIHARIAPESTLPEIPATEVQTVDDMLF